MKLLLILAVVLTGLSTTTTRSVQVSEPRSAAQQHVERHLDGALTLLAERDLRTLTAEQRERRSQAITLLRAYRDAGRFPQNRDYPGEYVPYFVDEASGAICAVGHLMAATGHTALVERISATNNHVRIRELADDAEVVAWLDHYGLTLDEAARIQPSYGGPPPQELDVRNPLVSQGATITLAGASALVTFAQAVQFGDATSHRLAPLGMLLSGLSMGAAIATMNVTGRESVVQGALGIGAVGFLMSGARIARARSLPPDKELASNVPAPRWQFAPTTDGRRVGLAARLTF